MHLLPDRFAKQLWCYEPCYMNPEQLPWEEGGIPVRTSQCWPSPAFPYLPPPSSPGLVILGLFIFLATFMSIKEQIAPVPNRVSRFTALLFCDAQLRQHHCFFLSFLNYFNGYGYLFRKLNWALTSLWSASLVICWCVRVLNFFLMSLAYSINSEFLSLSR